MDPVYEYFYTNYISRITGTRFPVNLWNCFGLPEDGSVSKTNNAIEEWHSVFKNTFNGTRYCYSLLIHKLKEEGEKIEHKHFRIVAGHPVVRKYKYVELKRRLEVNLNSESVRHSERFVDGPVSIFLLK